MDWPSGNGKEPQGVVDLQSRKAILFEGARHGTKQAKSRVVPLR